jgi:hypothetical protein
MINLVSQAVSISEYKYSHRILEMVPTEDDFRTNYRLEFLSHHIGALVVAQLEAEGKQKFSAFLVAYLHDRSSMTSPLAGVIYELLCHSKIASKQRKALKLVFRPLTESETAEPYTIEVPPDMDVVTFASVDEIVAVPTNMTHYKPAAKTVCALDAFVLVVNTGRGVDVLRT